MWNSILIHFTALTSSFLVSNFHLFCWEAYIYIFAWIHVNTYGYTAYLKPIDLLSSRYSPSNHYSYSHFHSKWLSSAFHTIILFTFLTIHVTIFSPQIAFIQSILLQTHSWFLYSRMCITWITTNILLNTSTIT